MAAEELLANSGAAARREPARRAAFLDRDGVINIDHGYVWRIADFQFVPGVLESAAELARHGVALVVVTNQAGIGRGMYTEADFARLTDWMRARFAAAGAPLDGVYHCPHHPTLAQGALRTACLCRKPAPGMLLAAARELGLDPARSAIFGDKCDDMRAGAAAGVGLRVLLGKDGRAVPTEDCGTAAQLDGAALVSLRGASLAHALGDARVRAALQLGARVAAPPAY